MVYKAKDRQRDCMVALKKVSNIEVLALSGNHSHAGVPDRLEIWRSSVAHEARY